MKGPYSDNIAKVIFAAEAVLAVCIITCVFISIDNLFFYIKTVVTIPGGEAYDIFSRMLGHILLMVVGLELALTLVRHDSQSILDVMIYGVARKLLVYPTQNNELLVGVIAVGALFLVQKYVHPVSAAGERNPLTGLSGLIAKVVPPSGKKETEAAGGQSDTLPMG